MICPGRIDCDVADTGSFDIPAPLVTALVALGRAGYPTVKLARTATASAPSQPGVKLVVSSRASSKSTLESSRATPLSLRLRRRNDLRDRLHLALTSGPQAEDI